jgi:hypothetical protein
LADNAEWRARHPRTIGDQQLAQRRQSSGHLREQPAAVLGRIHTGERDPGVLLDGLDDIDTAIARRALDIHVR